jgi:hypothetical protein
MPARPMLVNSLMQVPRLGRHVKRAHDGWLRRQCESYWSAERSPARRQYQSNKPLLTDVQQRVLTDLSGRGLAHVHFDELFGHRGLWDEMECMITAWADGDEVREKQRRYVDGGYQTGVFKEYLLKLYGFNESRVIPWSSPVLRMAVERPLLDIVNSYLGMFAILRYLDVWYTIPLDKERPLTGSQCWHRDPEDVRIAKVFLYFTDVTLESGALEYIPCSRTGDKYGSLWPHKVPSGSRAPTDEVAARIPPSDIEVCDHPRGTFVFVDTTGLHRGGRAISDRRIFACWEYVSPAAPFPRSFVPGMPDDPKKLSPAAAFALQARQR